VAGVVEAAGVNVRQLRAGDAALGFARGAFAEYACAAADKVVPKPEGLTFEQAAAIPVAATTALRGIRDVGQVQAGQQVLVNGAGGGVGTYAVQIAAARGAEVTGVCSARKALTAQGTLVLNGGGTPGHVFGPVAGILRAVVVNPVVSQRLRPLPSRQNREELLAVTRLIEDGKVTPVVDRTYPLAETAEGVRAVGQGHARGKRGITATRCPGGYPPPSQARRRP
jgi:NADPH:quinone reductase-like Zn-dependent oxidoreductase